MTEMLIDDINAQEIDSDFEEFYASNPEVAKALLSELDSVLNSTI